MAPDYAIAATTLREAVIADGTDKRDSEHEASVIKNPVQ
jgi:hypothetical protein